MKIMANEYCEIVRDLLPLYVDDVCSGSSREYVKEHLSSCGECRELEAKIRQTNIDTAINAEKESVLTRHSRYERSTAWKVGMGIAYVLSVPVIILAIVIAAGGGDSDILLGFPILISSMMLVASLTVVPLMSKQDKFPHYSDSRYPFFRLF